MKDKFYVVGIKKEGSPNMSTNYRFVEVKWTLGSALRKAKRYINKRGWKCVYVIHDKSCNVIYSIDKRFRGRGRNIENGEQ